MADLAQARAAKEHLRAALDGRSDVRGIGITPSDDGYRLQVNLERAADGVPPRVDGVDVRVRVVGVIHASA
jgi:hypothetical protein